MTAIAPSTSHRILNRMMYLVILCFASVHAQDLADYQRIQGHYRSNANRIKEQSDQKEEAIRVKYREHLEAQQTAAQNAGDLTRLLSLREELKRFSLTRSIKNYESDAYGDLRSPFLTALDNTRNESKTALLDLEEKYQGLLSQMVAALTKSQQIALASQINEEKKLSEGRIRSLRLDLEIAGVAKPPPVSPNSPEPPPPVPQKNLVQNGDFQNGEDPWFSIRKEMRDRNYTRITTEPGNNSSPPNRVLILHLAEYGAAGYAQRLEGLPKNAEKITVRFRAKISKRVKTSYDREPITVSIREGTYFSTYGEYAGVPDDDQWHDVEVKIQRYSEYEVLQIAGNYGSGQILVDDVQVFAE